MADGRPDAGVHRGLRGESERSPHARRYRNGRFPRVPGTGAAPAHAGGRVSGARAVLEVGTGAGAPACGLAGLDGWPTASPRRSTPSLELLATQCRNRCRRPILASRAPHRRARPRCCRAWPLAYDMVGPGRRPGGNPSIPDHAVRILRPGGTIVFVHALWRDQVADPARRDALTVVAREVVSQLPARIPMSSPALPPVGDGLAVAAAAERPISEYRAAAWKSGDPVPPLRSLSVDGRPGELASSAASLRAFSLDDESPAPFRGDTHDDTAPSALTSRGPSPCEAMRGLFSELCPRLLRQHTVYWISASFSTHRKE